MTEAPKSERIRLAIENAKKVGDRIRDAMAGYEFVDRDGVMERAAAIVSAGNFAGRGRKREEMLENHIQEWRMDMRYVDPAYRDRAQADPDGEFLGWLKERVGKTVWLSAEAQAWAVTRHPDQSTPALIRIWQAELGWAFRQRGVDDVRTAILAGIWYRQAMLETSKYFKAVVAAHFDRAIADGAYVGSVGREMTFADIMAAERLPDWEPLWKPLAAAEFAHLDAVSEERLVEEKARVELEYRSQLDRERSQRIAVLFAKIRPGRMPSVMKAAIAAGWDGQTLVEAEREFFGMLLDRKIAIVDPAGFGDREFVAWIASAGSRQPKRRAAALEKARRGAFFRGAADGTAEIRNARPVKWMPEEFEVFEHYRSDVVEAWKNAVWSGHLPCPETETERQEAFRGMLNALAKANVHREQVMGMAKEAEFIDHPVIVHYGWYLVKQAADRRAAIIGGRAALEG
jgi:hypothetical protein